jgi:hypothetical protein
MIVSILAISAIIAIIFLAILPILSIWIIIELCLMYKDEKPAEQPGKKEKRMR